MFTGLIESQAELLAIESAAQSKSFCLRSPFGDLVAGESIALNGVCLTYRPGVANHLYFDVSPETLKLTTLGQLQVGAKVNLERAMSPQGRFGGHYVSGHVDTTARLLEKRVLDTYVELVVGDFAMAAAPYLLAKASICLDGVSLTINDCQDGKIILMLVPHTLKMTTLGELAVQAKLNVEFDYLIRIVVHQLGLTGQLKHEG